MTINPKALKIRLKLDPADDRALPHLETVKPRKLEIRYKQLEPRPQIVKQDYFGLWSQALVYGKVVDGKPQDIIAKHDYSYEWDSLGLPIKQIETVSFSLYDENFHSETDIFEKHFLTDADKSRVLENRRKLIFSRMTGTAIASGLGAYSIPFFKGFSTEVNNYQSSGDRDLIDNVAASTEGWLTFAVPNTEQLLSNLSVEIKEFLQINAKQTTLNIKQSLLLNFEMALRIPSNEEIENSQ